MGLLDAFNLDNPQVVNAIRLMQARKGEMGGLLGQFAQEAEQRKAREMQQQIQRQQMEAQRQQMEMGGIQLQQARQGLQDEEAYRGAMQGAPSFAAPQSPSMSPTPENAAQLKRPDLSQQLAAKVEYLESKKVPEKYIKPYRDELIKLRPKGKADQQLITLPDGSLGMVNIMDDGSTQILPYKPAEKQRDVNLGGSVSMVGEYSGKQGQSFGKSMSPEGKDAAARGWAGLSQSERHFQQNQGKPQYDEGRGVFITPPTAQGGPTQIPVPGIQSGKSLPAGELDKLGAMRTMGRLVDEASADVTAATKKGVNVTGPALGRLPDFVRDFISAEGIPARQKLANLTSREFLERSGAAVTDGEAARLKPYTPQITDDEATVQRKLKGLKHEYQSILAERSKNYQQGGYRVPSVGWSIKPL